MTNDDLEIQQTEDQGRGAFFIDKDGERLARQIYHRIDDRHVNITHTEVSPQLQGRGIARRLLDATVAWARATGTRLSATCPYSKAQFEKDPSIRDVLAS
ncbi:MAG TPA: GNAT family N-acetyltransferase [Polyangia bacterium]|nr:GNAT family N-acetyltransferase [Polyangia bacterium]